MKTPDEIKKGLECCLNKKSICPGSVCPYHKYGHGCGYYKDKDALVYIKHLEERLADVNASPFDGSMSQAEYLNGEAGADG